MRSDDGLIIVAGLIVFVLLFVGGRALALAMASEGRARNAVENLGLRDVRVESKGLSWGSLGGCSDHDDVKFNVTGVTQDGQRRSFRVCATVPFGGYTVRS